LKFQRGYRGFPDSERNVLSVYGRFGENEFSKKIPDKRGEVNRERILVERIA
jgi:hypothetical protein